MSQMTDSELLQKIVRNQEDMKKDMHQLRDDTGKIKRAIYGDPDNLVSGLIHRQIEDENRIKNLENMRMKIIYISGGFVTALKLIEVIIL